MRPTRSTAQPSTALSFDFCGIEVDRDTGVIRIDKYVSLHDAGRILNPALFDGQVHGARERGRSPHDFVSVSDHLGSIRRVGLQNN